MSVSEYPYGIFREKNSHAWKLFYMLHQCKELETLSIIGSPISENDTTCLLSALVSQPTSIQSISIEPNTLLRVIHTKAYARKASKKPKFNEELQFLCALYYNKPQYWPAMPHPSVLVTSSTSNPNAQSKIESNQIQQCLLQGKYKEALQLHMQRTNRYHLEYNSDNEKF